MLVLLAAAVHAVVSKEGKIVYQLLPGGISLSATISFEHLYDEIEGDSASSTELYALPSSLSRLPIKQGIAVTGSVEQQRNIQPVGGVSEKIEGKFHIYPVHTVDEGLEILTAVPANFRMMAPTPRIPSTGG